MITKTRFNVEQSVRALKDIACKQEYRDGYHLGLNSKDFEEYGLAMEREFGELMYRYVLKKQPQTILELGTANGYSSCWFLLGLLKNGKGNLITVDKFDRTPKIWDVLNIPTHQMTAFIKLTKDFFKSFIGSLDMVLLDTEHRIEQIESDINLIEPFLNEGATLFIHDTFSDPDVGVKLKDFFMRKGTYDYESIDKSCGLGIATYKGEN